MTRIKLRKLDKIRRTLVGIDRIFVNRNDTNDQVKIHDLENKMNEKSFYGMTEYFNKINLGNTVNTSNRRINLKNSKRY